MGIYNMHMQLFTLCIFDRVEREDLMFKRLTTIMLISLVAMLSAAALDMKLYDYNSPDYIMVDKLTRLSGVIGPSSATPVTGEELYIALQRIDASKLGGRYKAEYQRLMEKFQAPHDNFSYDNSLYFAPQLYLSVDQKTIEPSEYFIPFERRLGAGYGTLSLAFGENLFLETSLEAINNSVIIGQNGIPYTSFDFIMSNRATGDVWNVVSTANPIQLYGEVPSMARGAIGNKWFSLIAGRTHHQMGSGYSGNLVIGDNYRFQEILKLTAQSNPFTYSLDFTHFDPQVAIDDQNWRINKHNFNEPQVLRLMHRLDFNIVDKARIALNLGFVMYGSNLLDMRLITPLFLVHNWYNFREGQTIFSGDESNNIMSMEVEWMALERLKLGLQIAVDQWQMFWEDDNVPDAVGLLFNVSYLDTLKHGDIEYYAEGIYTTPNFYLNTKYNQDGEGNRTRNYNYDFALGYFRRDTKGDVAWSGHKFGPNSLGVVVGAKSNFYDYNLKLDSVISFYTHGEIDFETPYFENEQFKWKGTPEHRMDVKCEGSWGFKEKLELLGGINFGFYWNYKHNRGTFKFMPQGMIGLKYTVV